jgi:hypothetical protein
VVNGCDVWVAGRVPSPETARLALVHRHSKAVRLLPEPSGADLAGQDLDPGALVATGRLPELLTDEDAGTWDLAVVHPGQPLNLIQLAEQALVYPASPMRPMPGPSGLVVTPYRTRDGRGAVGISVAPPSAEVTALAGEPGGLRITLELRWWSGPAPTSLVFEQRRGRGHLALPLETGEGRASLTVPVHLLARQLRDADLSVWDVATEGPAGRIPCGRTTNDVNDPRRVYRYPPQWHESDGWGPGLAARPYFTNDRTLALEVRGTTDVHFGS